jgi:hypothetical protein
MRGKTFRTIPRTAEQREHIEWCKRQAWERKRLQKSIFHNLDPDTKTAIYVGLYFTTLIGGLYVDHRGWLDPLIKSNPVFWGNCGALWVMVVCMFGPLWLLTHRI